MIFGIGTDIVEVNRMTELLDKESPLPKRVLTSQEMEDFKASKDPAAFLAKRFASKEAIVKAMGTGIGNGISWRHFEVYHDELGKPLVRCYEEALRFFEKHEISNCHLSVSDERAYAIAYVLLECRET